MEYQKSEIKAGLFILSSLILLFAFLFIIMGAGNWGDKDLYKTRFRYVGGVEPGSEVRFAGILVGQVKKVQLVGKEYPGAEIILEVQTGTPVRHNSKAFLTTVGIMGSFYVEITPGTPESDLLEPGSIIKSEQVTSYAQMADEASRMINQITELSDRLSSMFTDENRDHLTATLRSARNIAEITEKDLKATLSAVHHLSDRTEAVIDNLDHILIRNDSALTESVGQLNHLLTQSSGTVEHVNKLLDDLDYSITANETEIEQIIENMNSMTRNLNEFSNKLKNQPWSAVRKEYPPQRKIP